MCFQVNGPMRSCLGRRGRRAMAVPWKVSASAPRTGIVAPPKGTCAGKGSSTRRLGFAGSCSRPHLKGCLFQSISFFFFGFIQKNK